MVEKTAPTITKTITITAVTATATTTTTTTAAPPPPAAAAKTAPHNIIIHWNEQGWLADSVSLWNTHYERESEWERPRNWACERARVNEKYQTHGGGGDHDTPQQQYQTITRALCITSKRTSLSHIMCLLNTTDNERMPIASLFLPLAKRSCAWDNFFQFLNSIFGFSHLVFTYWNQTQKRKIQKENIRISSITLIFPRKREK